MTTKQDEVKPRNAPVQMPHTGIVPHGISFRVPWRIHLKAWETYSKHYPGQSAERLAERGGFGLEELIYFLAGEEPFAIPVESQDEQFTDKFEFSEQCFYCRNKYCHGKSAHDAEIRDSEVREFHAGKVENNQKVGVNSEGE